MMRGRTRMLAFTAALAMTAAGVVHQSPSMAAGCPGGMVGAGTLVSPCLVTSPAQLAAISGGLSLAYQLTGNINLVGEWTPIAAFGAVDSPAFTGTFDGAGFTISGLRTTDPSAIGVGFFGITHKATVRNVRLESVDVKGAVAVGGLVGVAYNTAIDSVSLSGSVHAVNEAAGGLIGYNFRLLPPVESLPTVIQNSEANVTITMGADGQGAGGLVGFPVMPVQVSNTSVRGSISAKNQVAGISPGPAVSITDSLSTAALTVAAGGTKGGLLIGGTSPATRAYFDSAAAGTTDAGVPGGVAKTALQLKQLTTYSGWDIGTGWNPGDDVWGICQSPDRRTLPFLNWTYSSSPCTLAPPGSPPTVTTGSASAISANGATLSATVNANDDETSAVEMFTTSRASDSVARIGTPHPTTPSSAEGDSDTMVQSSVTGLQPNTTYYYWISATNASGTSLGAVQTFTTSDGPPPLVACTSYAWPGGSGTPANPYLIDTYMDLYQASQCPAASFRQRANISLAPIDNWIPIGDLATPFSGTYDGGRYGITNLTYSDSRGDYVGLFGVTNGATIRNINAVSGSILGRQSVGGLVGRASSTTIRQVHSSIEVTGDPSTPAGGSSAAYYIGGLVGWMNGGSIEGCSSTGDVTATGDGGSTGNYVGGLVGNGIDLQISDSWASGRVVGIMYTGGLVGELLNASTVTRTYATGDVGGVGTGTAGGLIGQIEVSGPTAPVVTDVYAKGSVTVTRGGVFGGGIAGYIRGGTISRAYSTGAVSATGPSTEGGGFAGAVNGAASNFQASLWDTQTSGKIDGSGAGPLAGVTGKTTSEMTSLSTFSDQGWEISATCATTAQTVWAICPTKNGGYPLFPREPTPGPTPEPTPGPTPGPNPGPTPGPSGSNETDNGTGSSVQQPETANVTATPPPPIAPPLALRPGRGVATINGETAEVNVRRRANANTLSLSGPGFTTDFRGIFRSAPGSAGRGGQPALLPGRTVRVGGSGALPGSLVAVYLFSEPTTLTTILADAQGNFDGGFRVPPSTAKGPHALQVAMNTGETVNASVGVLVAASASRATKTVVHFTGSRTTIAKDSRSILRRLTRSLAADRDIQITCTASIHPGASSRSARQLARARSAKVCKYFLQQNLRHLAYSRATTSSSKRIPKNTVQVVAESIIT